MSAIVMIGITAIVLIAAENRRLRRKINNQRAELYALENEADAYYWAWVEEAQKVKQISRKLDAVSIALSGVGRRIVK